MNRKWFQEIPFRITRQSFRVLNEYRFSVRCFIPRHSLKPRYPFKPTIPRIVIAHAETKDRKLIKAILFSRERGFEQASRNNLKAILTSSDPSKVTHAGRPVNYSNDCFVFEGDQGNRIDTAFSEESNEVAAQFYSQIPDWDDTKKIAMSYNEIMENLTTADDLRYDTEI